jgi:hypothetical protein
MGLSTMVEVASGAQYNPVRPDRCPTLRESTVTLPLTLKKEGMVERHQIEGNDPSDRYFNRSMTVSRTASGYAAKVMYEALVVDGQSLSTIPGAVKSIVDKLREMGFRRMRTRANFKGRRYLAEKETWVDYPD